MKRLLRHPRVQQALAWLIGRYLGWALSSTRWTVIGEPNMRPFALGTPGIMAFWHEHLPLMPALFLHARQSTPNLRAHVLVSRHNDGRLIGDVIAHFGISVVHGSSSRDGKSRGGARGVLAMLGLMDSGDLAVITPDGPRGPRRVAAPGVAQLAALSGHAILPCAGHTTHCRVLGTWDRMTLPLPWGRGVFVCGPAITVPREDWEQALPEITQALNAASEQAAAACR